MQRTGGGPITQLTESGRAAFAAAGVSQVVANNSANLVYVGDAEVQPDDGFPICSTAGSCSHQALPADFTEGALYCTGTAAQGVRVLVGKPRP